MHGNELLAFTFENNQLIYSFYVKIFLISSNVTFYTLNLVNSSNVHKSLIF